MERPLKKKASKYVSISKVVRDKSKHKDAQHVIDAYNQKETPRSARSDTVLRMECSVKKLAQTGTRDVLMARLENHDRGLLVITKTHLAARTNLVDVSELVFFEEKQPAPVYGCGEMQLLGLPHDIIRTKILPALPVDDGSLFSLLFTCKFLHADALYYIRQRVKELFHNENATPMALSCFIKVRHYSMSRLERVFTIRLRHVNDDKDLLAIRAMYAIFNKYGSMEGWLESQKKKAELSLLKEEERLVVKAGIPNRFAELQAYIESLGFPRLYDSVNPENNDFFATRIGQIYEKCCRSIMPVRARQFVISNGFKKVQTVFNNNFKETLRFDGALMHKIVQQENFNLSSIPIMQFFLQTFYRMQLLKSVHDPLIGWMVKIAAIPNVHITCCVLVCHASFAIEPQLHKVGYWATLGELLNCIPNSAKKSHFLVEINFPLISVFGHERHFYSDREFNMLERNCIARLGGVELIVFYIHDV